MSDNLHPMCESVDDAISCSTSCGTPDDSCWWDDVFEAADLSRKDPAPYPAAECAVYTVSSAQAQHTLPENPKGVEDEDGTCDSRPITQRADSSIFSSECTDKSALVSSVKRVSSRTASERELGSSSLVLGLNQKEIVCLLYPSHSKVLTSKVFLNRGLAHVNSEGKLRGGRQLKSPCHDNCKRCEIPKLTCEERSAIFKRFWSLGNHDKQWEFIFNSVQVSIPLRKTATPGVKRKKFSSRSYYLSVNGIPRRLCKTMFKNTLCICDSWIDSALSHYRTGATPIPDMRGKSRHHFLQNLSCE